MMDAKYLEIIPSAVGSEVSDVNNQVEQNIYCKFNVPLSSEWTEP